MALAPEVKQKLDGLVSSDNVVLFMKGNRSFPQCGFSSAVVGILNTLVPKYATVNILADEVVRSGMKEYSEWPTFPQLYIKGEFVGGADIVRQMHESGELAKLLGDVGKPAGSAPPAVTVTPRAAKELLEALKDGSPGDVIHITITNQWDHQLDIGAKEASHVTVQVAGLTVQLDPASAGKSAGMVIDFIEGKEGAGFKIDNPNRPATVRQVGPQELKAMLDSGAIKHFYDVRTAQEYGVAKIVGATLVNDNVMASIEALDKATPLAFHCHHGGRSQNAAEHFLKLGFKSVYNLAGGIDSWSMLVDKTVPRY
jgi:monothiol glutaredoxin